MFDDFPLRDKNIYWTGITYFIGLYAFGLPWWQAGLIALLAMICWYLSFGRTAVAIIGVAILFAGLATWTGLIPRWHKIP
jgi:hypothetical protein